MYQHEYITDVLECQYVYGISNTHAFFETLCTIQRCRPDNSQSLASTVELQCFTNNMSSNSGCCRLTAGLASLASLAGLADMTLVKPCLAISLGPDVRSTLAWVACALHVVSPMPCLSTCVTRCMLTCSAVLHISYAHSMSTMSSRYSGYYPITIRLLSSEHLHSILAIASI